MRKFLETSSRGSKQQLALELLVNIERSFKVMNKIVGIAARQQAP